MSRCRMLWLCTNSRPATIHAAKNSASSVSTGLLFTEATEAAQVEAEVSAGEEVHHQVQVFPILKSILHVHDEGVAVPGEEGSLVKDRVDRPFRYDPSQARLPSLAHFLQRVEFTTATRRHNPDLAETALADYHLVAEATPVDAFWVSLCYASLPPLPPSC